LSFAQWNKNGTARVVLSRPFNAKAALTSLYKGSSDLFNIPSMMHPDVYNPVEKQAADLFKFHGKVHSLCCSDFQGILAARTKIF
jgi:hypothetical protein